MRASRVFHLLVAAAVVGSTAVGEVFQLPIVNAGVDADPPVRGNVIVYSLFGMSAVGISIEFQAELRDGLAELL